MGFPSHPRGWFSIVVYLRYFGYECKIDSFISIYLPHAGN